jgi:hypothetical protein
MVNRALLVLSALASLVLPGGATTTLTPGEGGRIEGVTTQLSKVEADVKVGDATFRKP